MLYYIKMTDIIQIPKREKNDNIYNNYWILYEESYKNNFCLDNYEFNNIKSSDEIYSIHDTIENIKHNFYKVSSITVVNDLSIKYMKMYIQKYNDFFETEVNELLLNGKITNFNKLFLSYNLNCECYFLNKYYNLINSQIDNINEIKEIELINFFLNFNKLIDYISSIDTKNILLKTLVSNISQSLTNIIIKYTKIKGIKFISDLLNKPYYCKLFKNNKIIQWFSRNSIKDIHNLLISNFDKQYSFEKFKEISYADELIDLIKIYNIIYEFHNKSNNNDSDENENSDIDNIFDFTNYSSQSMENLNSLTNYLCASLYFWMNKDNIFNVFNIIKFYSTIMPNKIDFLTFYKYHFQERVTHNLNYNFENKAFEFLLKQFKDDVYKANIDIIRNSLDDVYLSDQMNNEISNLNITFKTPEIVSKLDKIGDKYNIKKLNVFISSNIIWNSNNKINLSNKISLHDEISIYDTVIQNYYKSKYERRSLKISYTDSFIDITLGITEMRLPITYYTVLKTIGNLTDCNIENIVNKTNMDKDDISQIVDIFKINNIVYENENKLSISHNIINKVDERKINLMQAVINSQNTNLVKDEIDCDKDMLIDSVIMKTSKKLKNISYPRLIMIIRGELKTYFIPNENNVKNRINRLIQLGYIKINSDSKMYEYIP